MHHLPNRLSLSSRTRLALTLCALLMAPLFGPEAASAFASGEIPMHQSPQPNWTLGTGETDRIEGPCAMGSFYLEPLTAEEASKPLQQRSWRLSFSDFAMPFELRVEVDASTGAPVGWTAARPDGEAKARYGLRKDKVHLLSGQGGRQHETWLFDPTAVQDQAAGSEVNVDQALIHVVRAYAQLLVNSFTKGTQPLFSMSLLRHDLPPGFQLIGQPAFHPDAASRILDLDRNAVRKLEGTYASGTFAVVAPEEGVSVAAASGWIALVSGVWSESEGYHYKGTLPYGHTCNSAWSDFALPSYWTLLQSQGAGASGTNHIYTTPMLPGLAMIVTQSADSSLLTGMTLLHQPYMQGSVPPSLLPPFSPEQGWPQHIKALHSNAAMDWVLLSPAAKQRRALVPPEASPLDSSLLSSTVDGIPGALGFSVPLCPGSENAMQPTCAQRLAEQMHAWLGETYRMQGQFPASRGEHQDKPSARADRGGWILVHEEDAGAMPADRKHPVWELLLGQHPDAAKANEAASNGQPKGTKAVENSRFAQSPMLEIWVLPPGRRR